MPQKIITGDNMGILADSLDLYLPLYDVGMQSSPLTSKDTNGHSCPVTGTTWGAQGRAFDGNDLIDIDAALSVLADNTIGAISTWVKLTDITPASINLLLSFGDTDVLEFIRIFVNVTGTLYANCYKAGSKQWELHTLAAVSSNDTWFRITLTHDGTAPSLILNGTTPLQEFSGQVDKTVWFADCTGLDNGRVGCCNFGGLGNLGFLTGTVGEVMCHTRNVSVAEDLDNYETTLKTYYACWDYFTWA